MNSIFIDTGGWVALFHKGDKFSSRASEIYGKIQKGRAKIFTSDYVLDETLSLIKRHGGQSEAEYAGKAILESKIVTIIYMDSGLFQKSLVNFHTYRDKNFSFTDVSIITIMRKYGIKHILTFDEDLFSVGLMRYGSDVQ